MENILNETAELTPKEKGNSLELAVEHIFSVAGFNTRRNVFIARYEIDVQAEIGDLKVFIECKNYQNSSLSIRNLIHQWNSKNQVLKAHKIIIAVTGITIADSDYSLANEFDIELWNQSDLTELFNLSLKPDELRKKLIEKIDFRPLTIAERYRGEITYLVIKSLLSNYQITQEELFGYFNKWLRAFILTELQMSETSAIERAKYIELFEGSKTKKEFFNLISKKRKEVDYWNTVLSQLKSSNILSKERQDCYISYMENLVDEYRYQKEFFESGDHLVKTRKLIEVRLQNALLFDQRCSFQSTGYPNTVIVKFTNMDSVQILITNISHSESNILNWIMTSESVPLFNNQKEIYAYQWVCSSITEASEKVFRIFNEYFQLPKTSRLVDQELNN